MLFTVGGTLEVYHIQRLKSDSLRKEIKLALILFIKVDQLLVLIHSRFDSMNT